MVSYLVRSAGSCVLPVAGPRRFGGRRLPVAAAPVHHRAGLLAGWSVGIRAGGLDGLRPGNLLSTGASAWALKAAAGGTPSGAPGDEEEEDSELVRRFKVALMAAQVLPADAEPSSMELPGPRDQEVIGGVAERSFALWVEVTNRLRPPADSEIHERLHECGDVFVSAKVRKGAISWKRARDLAGNLELLRRIVSSALQAPLTPKMTYPVVPSEYDSKVALSLILHHTCNTVENDIHSMFDDELTTN